MCGIVGYIGKEVAAPLIMAGLKRVEYRGYDSAGIAALDSAGRLELRRAKGKLARLSEILERLPLQGNVAIGHTRWATHGKPEEQNAHPHVCGKVAVVHNGIIENYLALRAELQKKGRRFSSETDTEIIPQLIDSLMEAGVGPIEATRMAVRRLQGSFALAILFEGCGDLLVVVRKGSPLAIGFGPKGSFVGSGELALAAVADRVIHLEDYDMAVLTKTSATIYDAGGKPVERTIKSIVTSEALWSKDGYRHFMQKEIFEQPVVVGDTLRALANPATHRIEIPQLPFDFKTVTRLSLVACGTASYAGLVAKYWFKNLAGISADWDIASEFRYRETSFERGQAGIFISQSGETADTIAALKEMKSRKCPTLAIVNVPESTIAQMAEVVIPTLAGPEIGVASTKAFTTQLAVLACLAIEAARSRGRLSNERESELQEALDELPARIMNVLELDKAFAELALELTQARDVFYVGRGTSFPIALEGALKLKEISYIHAEGYAAGELKHGPLALVDKNVPVVVVAPRDELFDKTASNLQEIAARGGKIFLLSDAKGCATLSPYVYRSVTLPETDPFVSPILYAVALQLLAYHSAVLKGTDVDQPRNLAKSVTVE